MLAETSFVGHFTKKIIIIIIILLIIIKKLNEV